MMLPETRQFLRDYLDWVERGAPDIEPFSRIVGLCSNAIIYWPRDYGHEVWADLIKHFEGVDYPFGEAAYHQLADQALMHTDPKRLAFCREHAA